MSSLFLGSIDEGHRSYEIHAFTKDMPFRNYTSSQIADIDLYEELVEKRFMVLELGKPIYCTAINPDLENRKEENPHDAREGTVHIAAIDPEIGIVAGLSIAVEINGKDDGREIGLPLENKWRHNCFPEGQDLTEFKKSFLRKNYSKDSNIQPWEMAELYRHFKLPVRK